MTPFQKTLCLFSLIAVLTFSGCGKKAPAPEPATLPTETAAPTEDPRESVEELTAVIQGDDLYILDEYPNLKSADLRGSTCYSDILAYMAGRPQVAILYNVDVGGTAIENTSEEVTLEDGEFDYETVSQSLQYLPGLTKVTFPDMKLEYEELTALQEAYPQITFAYTVELLGKTLSLDTEELDLMELDSADTETAAEKLSLLPNLKNVKLSDTVSMEDVAKLQDSNENAVFHYEFKLFGKTVNTTDEAVEFRNKRIGDDGEAEIRHALEILDNCGRFVLDNCNISFEILEQLREDYRGKTSIVWRVYFGTNYRYNALTDDETIRAVYNLTDENCDALRYCEGAKYMDIGHNDTLTDLSFVSGMPNLEILIASGCAVTKLEGFENCKNLTWLELAYCHKLEDIESLSRCDGLRFLNLSFTKVESLMALDPLPLERFVYLTPKASQAERETFAGLHEDCLTVYQGTNNPYGYGWRYDDNGETFNEYYKEVVRKAFNYDELEKYLPKETAEE